ncbi:MAG: antitermination protein NusG, partial [Acidimicrobiales bacterium]
MELFNNFFDPGGAFDMLSRAGHVLAGITWIGLLYFFNFVQVPAYAQLSDGARSEALRKLTWRTLWWFRWAALATFLFGVLILSVQEYEDGLYFRGQHGIAILTGMLLGVTMLVNVWGIIWRNQQVVIGSAE